MALRPTRGGVTMAQVAAEIAAVVPANNQYIYPFRNVLDDPRNDNFEGAAIDTAGTRRAGAIAWAADNLGASVVVQRGRALWLQSPADGTGVLKMRGYRQALPAGESWCFRVPITLRPWYGNTTQRVAGLYVCNSGNDRREHLGVGFTGGNAVIWAGRWTNANAYSASLAFPSVAGTVPPSFLEMEYDAALGNLHYRWGVFDGAAFKSAPEASWTSAVAAFLLAAPTHIGVFSENDGGQATTGIFGAFYRVPVSPVL